MTKRFELHVAKCWDTLMPEERWTRWYEEAYGEHVDKLMANDVLRFATEIARTAYQDGVTLGVRSGGCVFDEELERVLDKRYPLPKPEVKYRTAGPDSNGNRWQVRDGITWFFHNGEFRRHLPVGEVLNALTSLGEYHNVAIVAELAANPTEE